MKKILMILFIVMGSFVTQAQVAINTTGSDPHASAMLDVQSTSKGLLIPRMTKAQRDAINSPATGLLIFQTDNTPGFYYYDGSNWLLFDGAKKINDLLDGKSDNDGTDDGSSVFLGLDAGANDDETDNRNVGVGYQSLFSNTSGSYNVAMGYNSLLHNDTNCCNTAIGHSSLKYFKGERNTAVGYIALYGHDAFFGTPNSYGSDNTAVGYRALTNVYSGEKNVAVGAGALSANYDGIANVAIGYRAMMNSLSASASVAIGTEALMNYKYAGDNVAVGYYALRGSTTNISDNTGQYNVALGGNSLQNNTKGKRNTGVGYTSLYDNTEGDYNTAVGYGSLSNNSTGANNTAVGYLAGVENYTGNNNTFLGYKADIDASVTTALTNATAIGYNAKVAQSNSLILGNGANVGIGTSAPTSPLEVEGTSNNLVRIEQTDATKEADIQFAHAATSLPEYQVGINTTVDGFYVWEWQSGGSGSYVFVIKDGGNVGIGITNPTHKLEVAGGAYCDGNNWVDVSTRRLKEDIRPIENALDKVMQLQGVTYTWKNNKTRDMGLIAEDVAKVVPEVVPMEDDGVNAQGLKYNHLVGLLVEAIKEQQQEINQLKQQLQQLQQQKQTLVQQQNK